MLYLFLLDEIFVLCLLFLILFYSFQLFVFNNCLLGHTIPWIKIPAFRTFSKPVDGCTGFDTSRGEVCRRDCLIDVDEVVEKVLRIVREELPKESDRTGGGFRKRVIMTSRLARGGKSTILEYLRETLNENGFRPILITLNGVSKFKRRQGESESASILRRLIALQLIDHTEEESIHFVYL